MAEKKKKGYLTVRVPDSVKADLRKIAVLERRTLSQVALLLLESALAERKNGAKK